MRVSFDQFKENLEEYIIDELDSSCMYIGGTTAKRTTYKVNGKILTHEEVFPYNFIKKPYEYTLISGNFPESKELPKGFHIMDIYHPEGFGDICTEKTNNFLESLEKAFELSLELS